MRNPEQPHNNLEPEGGEEKPKISRRKFLGALMGGGLAAKELLKPNAAEAGLANIYADRERAKTEIDRLRAMEFTEAVRGFCEFIKRGMYDAERFARDLFRPKNAVISDSELEQLKNRIWIIRDAVSSLKGAAEESMPVKPEEDYKLGPAARTAEIAAAVGSIVGETVGGRAGRTAGRIGWEAESIGSTARNEQVAREASDRYAGSYALQDAVNTLEEAQRTTNRLTELFNKAGSARLSDLAEQLSSDLSSTASFIHSKLSELERPRRARRKK